MSPTAPLRVRNESPSPSQTFPFNRDFWTANDQPKPAAVEVLSPRSISVIDAIVDPVLATSPQQECESLPRSTTTPTTVPLSPRPSGPRSPLPKAQIITPGLSSAHTRLRVVSGGGRRVSAGRETVPLKGDENVSPSQNTPPTIHISGKRQHSEDQLQSRKRSLSRSPLEPRLSDPSQILPDPLKVPSLSKRPGSRRSSAQQTPRKPSDPLTTPRTVSSGNVSLVPVVTGTTADYKTEHLDVHAAIEATRQRVSSDPNYAHFRLRNRVRLRSGSNQKCTVFANSSARSPSGETARLGWTGIHRCHVHHTVAI